VRDVGGIGVSCLGVLPNGNIISAYNNGIIRIWKGKILMLEKKNFFPEFAVCPNGNVAMLSSERTIKVCNFF
jgi:hypothetical protein